MRARILLMLVLFLAGCTAISSVAPRPPKLSVTTPSLPSASLNHMYTQQLTAVGGTAPYVWIVMAGTLPAGIILSPTGVLTGVPTQEGSFHFTVEVVDSTKAMVQIQIGGKINENS